MIKKQDDSKPHASTILSSLLTFWKQFKNYKPAYIGLVIVIFSLFIALLSSYIAPYNPDKMEFDTIMSPNWNNPLGTDHLGRDMLSRILYGLKTSIMIGFVAAGISTLIGVVLGAIPGYFGGKIDQLFSRFFEIFMMIPTFFLVILAAALFGGNINNIMIIIGLTTWPSTARIMRSQVLTLKNREYVESSLVLGGSDMYTLFRHIVPNGLYPVITIGTLGIGSAILTEAGLSFLGLGDPSAISLGKEIQSATKFLQVAPHLIIFPGLVLIILVFAFNMIGDGLNLIFNPRLKK